MAMPEPSEKEPPATIVTRTPSLRVEFIKLLKTGMPLTEISKSMGFGKNMARNSLNRLLWEHAYQLANEDEIAQLWKCVWALSRRLADLEKLDTTEGGE